MAALTTRRRKALPSSKFALPGKGEGMDGKGPGAYPVDTRRRAVSALSRVEQHGTRAEKAAVRAKVAGEYPGIEQSKGPEAKKTGGSRGEASEVNIRAEALAFRMHLENRFAPIKVGRVYDNLPVESARTQQSAVENFRSIGGSQEDDSGVRFEAIQLN